MADLDTGFGEQLKRIRLSAGLSQEELAERAGVSVRAISDLERGERLRPRRETLGLLFNALQVTDEERAQLEDSVRGRVGHAITPEPVHGTEGGVDLHHRPLVGNLPVPPSPLVARDRELEQITGLLFSAQVRLLTLTGPGGCGKTRLALELAARSVGLFPDGVHFVDLSLVQDHRLVLPAIARALRIPEVKRQPLLDTLAWHLEDRQLLLVLDNFEHVLDAGLGVACLLSRCPRVRILATSREALHVRAEVEYLVQPLALPDLASAGDPRELADSPAVAFFVAMVRRLDQSYEPEGAGLRSVAELCVWLDGLPLALELAASRVRTFTPDALLDRCVGSDVPGGAIRDLPRRQRTLKATLDWSYRLLSLDQQRCFRRLAAVAGEFGLEAVEAIYGREASSALDTFEALVEKHLIWRRPSRAGRPRYEMPRTARQYALDRAGAESDS